MKRMQYFSLLVTGICLPVFADPVLKVGTFQSKGASLEQPSLVEGNKRVGLRELYGSMFAGQDFKIGVYAGKEEICRIYFLGKFRGSWGFPFKAIPGKEKIAIDRRKSTISYCKEYQLPDKRIAQFRFTLAPEGPGRVRLRWDPGIPEKELSNIPNFELKPVVELPSRYREGGFQLPDAVTGYGYPEQSDLTGTVRKPGLYRRTHLEQSLRCFSSEYWEQESGIILWKYNHLPEEPTRYGASWLRHPCV